MLTITQHLSWMSAVRGNFFYLCCFNRILHCRLNYENILQWKEIGAFCVASQLLDYCVDVTLNTNWHFAFLPNKSYIMWANGFYLRKCYLNDNFLLTLPTRQTTDTALQMYILLFQYPSIAFRACLTCILPQTRLVSIIDMIGGSEKTRCDCYWSFKRNQINLYE